MTLTRPLLYRDAAIFFLPLLLNVQLMSVSHSVINAVLARQEDAIQSLAAFSMAMVVHLFFASPSYQNHTITITMVRGKQSLKGMIIFVLLVATYVSTMLWLIALTPLGVWLLEQALGINPNLTAETTEVIKILAFLPFFTGFRGLFQGIVIRKRKTGLISIATGVRIASLFGYLMIGATFLQGAAIGGFALMACVATETFIIGWFAWRCGIDSTLTDKERTTIEIIRYGFPLAYSSCLQQTIPLFIASILGRLPDATQALAGFGVIRGFLFMLAGPMRNLQQAFLTLVSTAKDYQVLLKFFIHVSVIMASMALIVAIPLNQYILGTVMGLEDQMRNYISIPLVLCTLFPFLYGASNLLRGTFAGAHLTGLLGKSTILKASYMFCCWLVIPIVNPPISGVVLGVLLIISAELVEAGYLFRQREKHIPPLPVD